MNNNNLTTLWHRLFVGFSVVNIIGEAFRSVTVMFTTKPFLMVWLSLYLYQSTRHHPTRFAKFILWGIMLSIAGDTFLMFVENPPYIPTFFLFGLGSFLLAHLCYIFGFRQYNSAGKGLVEKHLWLILPFVGFWCLTNALMWAGTPNDMKIPVLIYSAVITAMALFCLNLNGKMPQPAWQTLFLGVLLFLFSDTIIGLNKFYFMGELAGARLLIMIPYILGQYFIAKGTIAANEDLKI